jgi:hypothetical protein
VVDEHGVGPHRFDRAGKDVGPLGHHGGDRRRAG